MAPTLIGTDLISEEDLVLPDNFRPYTPPGASPIRIPSRIAEFRPVNENSSVTRDTFTQFFHNTRTAAAMREGVEVTGLSYDAGPSFPDNPLPTPAPAEGVKDEVPDVLRVHDDDTIQYLNLEEVPGKEGMYRALDDQDLPLLNSDRKEIYTDGDGWELPPKDTFLSRVRGRLANTDGAAGGNDKLVVYTADGTPIGDFDVVAPGHAPSDGRGRRGVRALALLCAAGMGLSAVVGVGGILLGRGAVPAEGQITAAEATNYNLSTFPVEAGAAFAQHYLNLCLTHPQYREDIDARNEMMLGMEAPGVPPNCGWERGGSATAPTSITFNGDVEERPEYADNGGDVAYLGFFVTMQDGRHFTATVPVWAGTNAAGRQAYSVVGTVGMSAATAVETSPNMTIGAPMDRKLANAVEPTLATFFEAWAESDERALDTILVSGAQGEARAGLGGAVSNPSFNSVVIYPDRAPDEVSGDTATWDYVDGDSVTAMVGLTWNVSDAAGGHEQPAGYRVSLLYMNGKWEIAGLQSGVVVPDGTATGQESPSAGKNPSGTIGGGLSGGFSLPGEGGEDAPAVEEP